MMNERIKELMLKAGGVLAPAYVTDENDNSIWTDNAKVDTIDMDAEYFAKLLVRECAQAIINDGRLNDVRSAANGCVRTINEHFGVE